MFLGSLKDLLLFSPTVFPALFLFLWAYFEPVKVYLVLLSCLQKFKVVHIRLLDIHESVSTASNTLAKCANGWNLMSYILQRIHLFIKIGRPSFKSKFGQGLVDVADVEVQQVDHVIANLCATLTSLLNFLNEVSGNEWWNLVDSRLNVFRGTNVSIEGLWLPALVNKPHNTLM